MPAKQFASMSVKALAEDGSFEGILASYNTVDLGGDRILPGAFTKTMQERGSSIPMLWQHDPHQPIGTLDLSDSPAGLMVKGNLLIKGNPLLGQDSPELPQARVAYSLLKAKVIKGLSIGYDTVKDAVDNGVRQLKEVRLWEGSCVTFPMNEACMITAIKKAGPGGSEKKDDFNTELAEIQLQDAGYQMRYAFFNALGSFVWADGLSSDDKLAASKDTIDQFAAAYLAYLPQYLQWLSVNYGMEWMGRVEMEEKGVVAQLGRSIKGLTLVRKGGVVPAAIKAALLELKAGAKISADTRKKLTDVRGHAKDMGESAGAIEEIFGTLLDDEADADPETDDDTSKTAAVTEVKTEPVAEDHSAAITALLSLIPKA